MNNSKKHEELVNEILLKYGAIPGVRLWKRKVGMATPIGGTRPVKFGLNGEADIGGIAMPNGRMIAIEVKTGTGKLSDDQLHFQAMAEKYGALFILARDQDDVYKAFVEAGIIRP